MGDDAAGQAWRAGARGAVSCRRTVPADRPPCPGSSAGPPHCFDLYPGLTTRGRRPVERKRASHEGVRLLRIRPVYVRPERTGRACPSASCVLPPVGPRRGYGNSPHVRRCTPRQQPRSIAQIRPKSNPATFRRSAVAGTATGTRRRDSLGAARGQPWYALVHIEAGPFTFKGARKTTHSGAFESKVEKNDQKPRVSPCLSYQNGGKSALALPKTRFGPSQRPILGLPAKGRFLKLYTGGPLADARGSDPAGWHGHPAGRPWPI